MGSKFNILHQGSNYNSCVCLIVFINKSKKGIQKTIAVILNYQILSLFNNCSIIALIVLPAAFSRSAANVYCVRSFVPKLRNSACCRMSGAARAAAGVSIIAPSLGTSEIPVRRSAAGCFFAGSTRYRARAFFTHLNYPFFFRFWFVMQRYF